jgi:hypothetical protein
MATSMNMTVSPNIPIPTIQQCRRLLGTYRKQSLIDEEVALLDVLDTAGYECVIFFPSNHHLYPFG